MLTQNRTLIDDINRRNVLRGAISLGALSLLTGCDVSEHDSVQKVLRTVSGWNDRVQATIFRPHHLAPTYSASQVVKPPRFNAYYDIEEVKPIDGATWKLELAGRIRTSNLNAQQIYQLPEQEIIIKHICVEGWDYIGQWSGPTCAIFLERVGADLKANTSISSATTTTPRASTWRCAASADHPRDQICRRHSGRSVRLSAATAASLTKLGYKNAKWIKAIEVTNDFRETFWSKQGFNWFAGI